MDLYLEGSEDPNDKSIKIQKGEFLFLEGEASDSFYIVKSGMICCFKRNQHRITPIYSPTEKEFVGEDCVFEKETYQYNAIAYEDSSVIRIKKTLVEQFLESQNDWMTNIFKTLTNRTISTAEIISAHHLHKSELFAGREFTNEDEVFIKNALKARSS